MGKVVLTVLGMVAEMELEFIRERQRAGIEAAKERGVYKGRPVMALTCPDSLPASNSDAVH